MNWDTPKHLVDKLATRLQEFRQCWKDIKILRDKTLAHSDKAARLKESELIPGPSRAEIEDALKSLRSFMQAVDNEISGDEEIVYDYIISSNDGESLLSVLKQGLKYQELYSSNTCW